jgi:hypothetical protein
VSDRGYQNLINELVNSGIHIKSLKATRHYLQSQFNIHIKRFHRCNNNCMVFIGDNLLRRQCRYCKTPRFFNDDGENAASEFFPDVVSYANLSPRAVYEYIPIIPRLQLLYANSEYAGKMRYPQDLKKNPWDEGIRDIWEGSKMKYWQSHSAGILSLYSF